MSGSFTCNLQYICVRSMLSCEVIGVETMNFRGLIRTIYLLLQIVKEYASYDNLHNKFMSLTIRRSVGPVLRQTYL